MVRRHFALCTSHFALVVCAGCAWFAAGPLPPDPQVEIAGSSSAAPTLQTAPPENPYAGMGAVARGSSGVDRTAWPVQRLAVGGPAVPAYLVPYQDEAECADYPDRAVYWSWDDAFSMLRSNLQFPLAVILTPLVPWPDWKAPVPEPPPSPYGAPQP